MSPLTIFLLIAICKISFTTGFMVKAYLSPSNSSNFPRIKAENFFPSLWQFTMCSWLKPYPLNDNELTIISYATSRHDEAIYICLKRRDADYIVLFRIQTGWSDLQCALPWKQGQWYHLCATWFAPTKTIHLYQNGQECEHLKTYNDFPSTEVPSGGTLVIGQDQDAPDSKYQLYQSYHGDIAEVHFWDEQLSLEQIRDIGSCKGSMIEGNLFAWMKTPMTVKDNVVLSATHLCYN
ncbi:C-reactive protein 1.4-like isoform X1 [Centruroides sculpturatus]|uniref:C-reactive protein 1.4-like isoform X1 n=1 Tax=Centruroides sculpturatus TaxID=218467 RepID=UPI000C6ED7AE|nr:C-reactive protein 1.4-like isoform X1 [Centruroides sculpturatus]